MVREPGQAWARSSLSWYLIRRTVLVVLLTVLVGGLPAAIITYTQLEHQVWLRVESAQSATLSLYQDERDWMGGMTRLVAQRVTLCALVEAGDTPHLPAYLEDLRQSIRSDFLIVAETNGRILGESGVMPEVVLPVLSSDQLPILDFRLSNNAGLMLLAVYPLEPPPGCDPGGARVAAGRILDADFMAALAERTGVAQSLIVDGRRVSTSLAAAPDWSFSPSAVRQVARTGTACCTRGSSQDEVFYVGVAPLTDRSGNIIAMSEVALPATAIRAGILRAMLLLLGAGSLAALIGSRMAVGVARHISAPLSDLAASARRLGQGDLETVIVTSSDVSEVYELARHLNSARLNLSRSAQLARKQRQRIERLLEATHDGVITLDEVGRVTSVSAMAEQILGYPAYDLLEKRHLEVFRPAPNETITTADLLNPAAGMPPVRRLTVLNAKDEPIILEVLASWLDREPAVGSLRERAIAFRDVSEEAAFESLRSTFLANVSHEFRTPLSAVIASVEMLAEEGRALSEEEFARLADTTQAGIRHLRTLVDNLLESASIEAGTFRVSYRPVSLQDVLSEAAQTMHPLLHRRSQTLITDMPELPLFYADPDRLVQVFVNLIANASKFGPIGQPIVVTARQEAQSLRIAVMDFGPGLPGEHFGDLFKRFVTGSRTRTAQYGIGLGLAVVKAVIEAHGGQIGAENRSEGGATVWFTLPLEVPMGEIEPDAELSGGGQ